MNREQLIERERLLREEELTFFGAVTAAMSHDLNNAMAVIEQAAGLLEDLIAGSGSEGRIPNERLQTIAERIGNQTKRGATIIRRLNTFAHSVDDTRRDLDLNDLADDVVALAHHLAERRRIQLETRPSDGRAVVCNSPFRVQRALYWSLQQAVSAAPEGSKVTVAAGTENSLAWVSVEGEALDSECAPDPSYLEMLMDQIGGTMECKVGGGAIRIKLVFSSKTAES